MKKLRIYILCLLALALLVLPALASQEAGIRIPIEVEAASWEGDSTVRLFALESLDSPGHSRQVVSILGNGKKEFAPLEFYEPGNYKFRVLEEGKESFFDLEIIILTDDDGNLSAASVITEGSTGKKADRIVFTDTKPVPPVVPLVPEAPPAQPSSFTPILGIEDIPTGTAMALLMGGVSLLVIAALLLIPRCSKTLK